MSDFETPVLSSSDPLRGLDLANRYSTSTDSLLRDFYVPVLTRSRKYDRAVGFFSSSLLALAPLAFSDFFGKGGRVRLLCSPHLSAEDAEAVTALPAGMRPSPLAIAEASFRELVNGSRSQAAAARCFSSLIEFGALEVKFAVPKYDRGLFHDKIGTFSDDSGNVVAFSGSANETAAALSGLANHEQITVFRSWNPNDSDRCSELQADFDELWHGLRRGLTVSRASDAAAMIRTVVPAEPLDDVLRHFKEVIGAVDSPQSAIALRSYQEAALESWRGANNKGIISFATGGGKTRTALEAIREWTETGKPALVLVPTKYLHEQWCREIKELLPGVPYLSVGAGTPRSHWLTRLLDYTSSVEDFGPRIVISTYRSAAGPEFEQRCQAGEHLLVVADEVHGMGAPDTRQIMSRLDAGGRLGLSATPERFGDPSGTAAIFDYFGPTLEPEFGIAEALEAGVLVKYQYGFEQCALNEDEQESWDALSLQIAQAIARDDGEITERTRLLIIQRARIAKRAAQKAELAYRVLAKEYQDGDRWLVYCADIEHLRQVRRQLESLGIDLLEYHSETGDQEAEIDYFETRGGVLLAIKCLDEGVDIPLINKALILSSSTNPREYIQRRGRILRRSPGKYFAKLFDVLLLDEEGAPLMPSEVERAMEFASHAMNDSPLVYLNRLHRRAVASGRASTNLIDVETE